jgi:malate synthase
LGEVASGDEYPGVNLMIRPRGLSEAITIGSAERPAGLAELCAFLVAFVESVPDDRRPCVYLPDVGSREEARKWDAAISYVESGTCLADGSVLVTPEICRTAGAAEIEEILWELRRRAVAVNIRYRDELIGVDIAPGPDTSEQSQGVSPTELKAVIETCNRRGAQAICGVRGAIPLRTVSPSAAGTTVELARAVPQTRRRTPPGTPKPTPPRATRRERARR